MGVEVDGEGGFVEGEDEGGVASTQSSEEGKGKVTGRYQSSGTYRVMTREGMFGLSPYLRGKLVERLKVEEERMRRAGL